MKAEIVYNTNEEPRVLLSDFSVEERQLMERCGSLKVLCRGSEGILRGDGDDEEDTLWILSDVAFEIIVEEDEDALGHLLPRRASK